MKKFILTTITACLSLAFINQTNGQVIVTDTIFPFKDNTLIEDLAGNLSNGAGMYFFAGRVGGGGGGTERRGVLAFDVASHIQPNAIILSAVLQLHKSKGNNSGQNIRLHRLGTDWGEGASIGPMGEGGGAPAALNDATWLCTFSDGAGGCNGTWAAPGGDFSPTASTQANVSVNGFYSWPTTPGMVADVQAMLDQPANNFGWVVLGNTASPGTAVRFDSKDNINPLFWPMLIVQYQVNCINGTPALELAEVEGDADIHGSLHVGDVLKLQPRACEPDSPVEGMLYYDLVLKKLRVYDGAAWQDCW